MIKNLKIKQEGILSFKTTAQQFKLEKVMNLLRLYG